MENARDPASQDESWDETRRHIIAKWAGQLQNPASLTSPPVSGASEYEKGRSGMSYNVQPAVNICPSAQERDYGSEAPQKSPMSLGAAESVIDEAEPQYGDLNRNDAQFQPSGWTRVNLQPTQEEQSSFSNFVSVRGAGDRTPHVSAKSAWHSQPQPNSQQHSFQAQARQQSQQHPFQAQIRQHSQQQQQQQQQQQVQRPQLHSVSQSQEQAPAQAPAQAQEWTEPHSHSHHQPSPVYSSHTAQMRRNSIHSEPMPNVATPKSSTSRTASIGRSLGRGFSSPDPYRMPPESSEWGMPDTRQMIERIYTAGALRRQTSQPSSVRRRHQRSNFSSSIRQPYGRRNFHPTAASSGRTSGQNSSFAVQAGPHGATSESRSRRRPDLSAEPPGLRPSPRISEPVGYKVPEPFSKVNRQVLELTARQLNAARMREAANAFIEGTQSNASQAGTEETSDVSPRRVPPLSMEPPSVTSAISQKVTLSASLPKDSSIPNTDRYENQPYEPVQRPHHSASAVADANSEYCGWTPEKWSALAWALDGYLTGGLPMHVDEILKQVRSNLPPELREEVGGLPELELLRRIYAVLRVEIDNLAQVRAVIEDFTA